MARRWWHTPLISTPEAGRGRQISEFKASLVYKVSSRTASAIQRNHVLKNQNQPTNQTNKQKLTRLFPLSRALCPLSGLILK